MCQFFKLATPQEAQIFSGPLLILHVSNYKPDYYFVYVVSGNLAFMSFILYITLGVQLAIILFCYLNIVTCVCKLVNAPKPYCKHYVTRHDAIIQAITFSTRNVNLSLFYAQQSSYVTITVVIYYTALVFT